MKIHKINKHLIDVFIDLPYAQTGYDPSCWLRLQLTNKFWTQVQGIRVKPWKYKQIIELIAKEVS